MQNKEELRKQKEVKKKKDNILLKQEFGEYKEIL